MKIDREKILLEEYFPYENMTVEERDFIITFLCNTKELEDNSDMRIVQCNLKKVKDNIYKVNGAIYSDINGNRGFDAYITIEENIVSIKSDMVKLCSRDIHKEFTEYTTFTMVGNDMYHRQTKYSYMNACFESDIVINNFDIIYQSTTGKQKS